MVERLWRERLELRFQIHSDLWAILQRWWRHSCRKVSALAWAHNTGGDWKFYDKRSDWKREEETEKMRWIFLMIINRFSRDVRWHAEGTNGIIIRMRCILVLWPDPDKLITSRLRIVSITQYGNGLQLSSEARIELHGVCVRMTKIVFNPMLVCQTLFSIWK